MKQAVWTGKNAIEMRETAIPEPGPGETLVRTIAASICATDLSIYGGFLDKYMTPPHPLGHEGCGVVERVGANVTALAPGDRIVLEPNVGCETCWYCTHGNTQLCDQPLEIGFVRPGVFADYFLAPPRYLHPLPDNVSFDEASLTDIAANTLHAVQLSDVKIGDTVAVFGAGPAGLLAAQFAKLAGAAHVCLFGPNDGKIELGRSLGISLMCDNTREDPEKFLRDNTGRDTVDVSIDCSAAEAAIGQMVHLTRKLGRITLFGLFHGVPQVDLTDVAIKEITLRGSCAGPGCYGPVVAMIAQKRLVVEPLISHRFALADAPEAFAAAAADRNTYRKVLLYPDGVPA